MFRFSALAIFCLAAVPAFAQNQTAPAPSAPAGPPPEAIAAIQTAAAAFGQCVQTGAQAVPAAVTPEAGATNVLAGCATQQRTLEQAVRSMIATLPAEQRTAAEAQLNAQLGTVHTQVANGIRQARGATPPAAAPAPTPGN